jgi:hypothetical protein
MKSFLYELIEISKPDNNATAIPGNSWHSAAGFVVYLALRKSYLFGIIATTLLVIFYVVPYQKASASLRSDFDFNWFRGEALFAYVGTALFVFKSWLMSRGVQSSYLPKPPATHTVS